MMCKNVNIILVVAYIIEMMTKPMIGRRVIQVQKLSEHWNGEWSSAMPLELATTLVQYAWYASMPVWS